MRLKDLKVIAFLAYKNIAKSKATFAVIVAVMAMSFLSVTFFAAIIEGLGHEFEESRISTLTGHLTVEPTQDNLYLQDSRQLVDNIQRIPGVEGAARRLQSSAVVKHQNTELGSSLYFIDPQDELEVSRFHDSMLIGEFLSKKDTNELLIGANVVESYADEDDTRKRLDVQVGDTVEVGFSNGKVKEYKIKGVFETGFRFADDKVLLNIDEYEKIFNQSGVAHEILVNLPGRGREEHYQRKIMNLGVSAQINPWQTKMGTIKQFVGSLQVTNKVTGLVGLLTAFATIYIIIFINVTNKRKQIGILKAVGIKKRIILGSYVFQSLIYGVTGVILGNVVMQGLLLLLTMYPLTMPIGDVVPILTSERLIGTSVTLIVASLVAGYFPSRSAANDNILEAIFGG